MVFGSFCHFLQGLQAPNFQVRPNHQPNLHFCLVKHGKTLICAGETDIFAGEVTVKPPLFSFEATICVAVENHLQPAGSVLLSFSDEELQRINAWLAAAGSCVERGRSLGFSVGKTWQNNAINTAMTGGW